MKKTPKRPAPKKRTPAPKKAKASPPEPVGVGQPAPVSTASPPAAPVTTSPVPRPAALARVEGRRPPFAAYKNEFLQGALERALPGVSFDDRALRQGWRKGQDPRAFASSFLAGIGPLPSTPAQLGAGYPEVPPAPFSSLAGAAPADGTLGCPPAPRSGNPVPTASAETAYARWHQTASRHAAEPIPHASAHAAWLKGLGPKEYVQQSGLRRHNPSAWVREPRNDRGRFWHDPHDASPQASGGRERAHLRGTSDRLDNPYVSDAQRRARWARERDEDRRDNPVMTLADWEEGQRDRVLLRPLGPGRDGIPRFEYGRR